MAGQGSATNVELDPTAIPPCENAACNNRGVSTESRRHSMPRHDSIGSFPNYPRNDNEDFFAYRRLSVYRAPPRAP